MSQLTARNIALTDQALAYLADSGPLPVSTRQVADALNLRPGPEQMDAWRILDRLARQERVQRIRVDGYASRYWLAVSS